MAVISAKVNGEKLKRLRGKRLMTQMDLAEAANLGGSVISRMEREIVTVRPSTVKKIAAALDVEPEELL